MKRLCCARNPRGTFGPNVTLLVAFVLWMTAVRTATAQMTSKALFDGPWEPPMMCIGGGFVAMLGPGYHQPLIVIKIGDNGIAALEKLSIEGNETFGMQCVGSYIEILVRETDSDHFSVLPFDVQQGTIEREQREDLNYSISLAGPMPAAIQRRMDEFHRVELYPGRGLLGDWYVPILRTGTRHHAYAVHFVMKETRIRQELAIGLVVDLLEENLGKLPFSIKDGRITQLVPLIREQDTAGDQG